MTHETAKKLKDAGFPQPKLQDNPKELAFFQFWQDEDFCFTTKESYPEGNEWVYIPTLEELIKDCGDKFRSIEHFPKPYSMHEWYALTFEGSFASGPTPEESVANLWLALNSKN